MEIQTKITGTKAFMAVSGSIDIPGAERLKTSLAGILDSDAQELTIDFQGVRSIGSSGIGKLLLFQKDFTARGGRIAIINLNKEITMVFRDAKLDKLFNI
jgi:anti-sigma B factor antagonist